MREGNSWEDEKRKFGNQNCPALQISLSGEKVISGNIFFPGTGPHSNVNFPYERGITTLVFRVSPLCVIPQNNQLNSFLRPKRPILGWPILLPGSTRELVLMGQL